MSERGLTKARSMGPVAAAVRRSGGSLSRVFRKADLPLRIVEQPDALIPLRDQLKLVECAAREIGDEALPARLSTEAGVAGLGPLGDHVCSAPLLSVSIARANDAMGTMLQSSTHLRLIRTATEAIWTYSIADSAQIGRQKNEILALGYMLDLLHRYLGTQWSPTHAALPGAPPAAKREIQDLLHCEITSGNVAAVVFPAHYLDTQNRALSIPGGAGLFVDVPRSDDLLAHVEHMILLGLLERRPTVEWVCRRLDISKRSLQRRLAQHATSFEQVRRHVLLRHACSLLTSTEMSITQIALELGYSDPAHFTRAFIAWQGVPPVHWRSQRIARKR